jgi:hypothetical protein
VAKRGWYVVYLEVIKEGDAAATPRCCDAQARDCQVCATEYGAQLVAATINPLALESRTASRTTRRPDESADAN